MSSYMCICVYIHVYTRYVCMYARAYVCACLYIHVYKDDTRVCMHVHTVCLYVCVYVRVDMITY